MSSDPGFMPKRFLLWVVVLILVAGAGAYLLHRRGVDLRSAFASLLESSEEAATTAKVKTAMALSQRVSAFDIDVDTRGRTVTLTGQVPSEAARRLAVAIAQETSGVDRVENALTVDPATLPDPEIERLAARVADLEIKTAVTDALRQAPALAGQPIDVAVENKVVILTGALETADQRYVAERLAAAVEAAEGVRNKIRVVENRTAESQESADERLARQVEFELYLSKAYDLSTMAILSRKGRVTLSGSVRSVAEKLLAERLAREVKEVHEVANRLRVAESEAPTP